MLRLWKLILLESKEEVEVVKDRAKQYWCVRTWRMRGVPGDG